MPAQPNRSLADGIALLGLLCSTREALGTREAARQLGWEATRANRLLGTLRDMGLAAQDGQRRYRPGPGVHLLAVQCLHGSGLLSAAIPVLEVHRHDDLGFALGVLWQGRVCYLLHAPRGRALGQGLDHATLLPAEGSSIGMALEAAATGPTRTPATEIARIRARGYAIQRNADGHTGSVALAIPGASPADPPVAALAGMADYDVLPPARVATRLRPLVQAIAARLHAS